MPHELTRRQLLAAAGLGLLAAGGADPVETFRRRSAELTGFPVEALDPELARRYLQAVDPADDLAVIEAWYTGTVPTGTGTKVITYRDALAFRCLPMPPTYCG